MYVPLFCIYSLLTPHSVYGRLEALGRDRQDMKWDEDTDWGKLFTEGGEVNETCTRSSTSLCRPPFTVVLPDWQRSSLPSLECEITNWQEARMVDELCECLAVRYTKFVSRVRSRIIGYGLVQGSITFVVPPAYIDNSKSSTA